MSTLRFRTSFSVRTRLGTRRKYLNRRTSAKEVLSLPPIVVIDLDYIETLLNSRKQSKVSKYYNAQDLKPLFHSWLNTIFHLTTPSGVLFIAEKETAFTKHLKYPVVYANIRDYLYSVKVNNLIQNHLCILSNNLELWSLSSNTANLSFLAIDTNNRILHYNNTTGLEIVSKFIGTYKIINKLGLGNLKYMNLQYLFILLHYLKITNKTDRDFYLDGQYFRNVDKYSTPFLKSNGLGLRLIADAHKFLSYAFLTKPEFLDYFLLGNSDHYELQLSRLAKLLPIDIKVLRSLKQQYDSTAKPQLLPNVEIPNLQPTLDARLSKFHTIWSNTNTASSYTENKELAKYLRKYSKFSSYDISDLIQSLPQGLQTDFKATPVTQKAKSADTSDIEDYVSNLISGVF